MEQNKMSDHNFVLSQDDYPKCTKWSIVLKTSARQPWSRLSLYPWQPCTLYLVPRFYPNLPNESFEVQEGWSILSDRAIWMLCEYYFEKSTKDSKIGCSLSNFLLYCRLQAFASSETIQNWLRRSRPSPLKQGLLKWWVHPIYSLNNTFHMYNVLLNF